MITIYACQILTIVPNFQSVFVSVNLTDCHFQNDEAINQTISITIDNTSLLYENNYLQLVNNISQYNITPRNQLETQVFYLLPENYAYFISNISNSNRFDLQSFKWNEDLQKHDEHKNYKILFGIGLSVALIIVFVSAFFIIKKYADDKEQVNQRLEQEVKQLKQKLIQGTEFYYVK